MIPWEGTTYTGKHVPMVTLSEFERVQELLGRPGRPRRQRHEFPFTGMIRCGECGFMVTAEHKRNRYGSDYTYYHCSWRRPDYRCHQPSLQEASVEGKLREFLEEIAPPDSLHEWALNHLGLIEKDTKAVATAQRKSLEQALQATRKQLQNLTTLRLRDLISDEEFLMQRETLQQGELNLVQQEEVKTEADLFEPLDLAISFSKSAVAWFGAGDPRTKRTIITITGSNLVLKDRELMIDGRKPFRRWTKKPTISQMCAFLSDVRTELGGPRGSHLLETLRDLSAACEPLILLLLQNLDQQPGEDEKAFLDFTYSREDLPLCEIQLVTGHEIQPPVEPVQFPREPSPRLLCLG